jgi:hypothetical protein
VRSAYCARWMNLHEALLSDNTFMFRSGLPTSLPTVAAITRTRAMVVGPLQPCTKAERCTCDSVHEQSALRGLLGWGVAVVLSLTGSLYGPYLGS